MDVCSVESAVTIPENSYIIVTDESTGTQTVQAGPQRYMPCAGTSCAEYSLGSVKACR